MRRYLAVDIGAESGRVMLGELADGKLELKELHRFPNQPVRVRGNLYWDILRLFHEVEVGLAKAKGIDIAGIGVDTWGVDFGLLATDGTLVDNPRHYRDARSDGVMEKVFAILPRGDIFADTGVQFMPMNSLYQLYASRLDAVKTLLFVPDLINYWLTGTIAAERTIASTSQFYDPTAQDWARELLGRLGLPCDILPPIVEPGTQLGVYEPLGSPVFAVGGHDTASAVAAVPTEGEGWCYISSGTWSLMGVETARPVINDAALAANFTNEIGVGGTVRLLKNIAGLWLLQECRKAWANEGREYSYEQLVEMAAHVGPLEGWLDVDAFSKPGEMPKQIADWCSAHGQRSPLSDAEMARAIFDGLAARYSAVKETLEKLAGKPIARIHIVGGGSKNALLNQLTANATGCTVVAGPVEATAIGNVLIQATGGDLGEIRKIVRASFPLRTYEPARAS